MSDNLETTLASSIRSGTIQAIECGDHALTVPEVATVLRVTPGTIYRLAHQHAIPSFRIGGSIRFDPRTISKWMQGLVSA